MPIPFPLEGFAMSKKLNDRVAALRKRRAEIDARLNQLEAREKSKERKRDTRRKVIAGAYALEHCEFDPAFKATLFGLLDQYVERAADRELFDLAAKPDAASKSDKPKTKGADESKS